jgi:hypothetical protein
MIGDAPIKMCQISKKTVLTLRAVHDSGFIKVKIPQSYIIQLPPTIFYPMFGNNYLLQKTEMGRPFLEAPRYQIVRFITSLILCSLLNKKH